MDSDQQQLFQHLGFCGIFKEAYKLTVSWWNQIFSKIFLSLILPFCLLILADMHISGHLTGKIINRQLDLYDTSSDDPTHYQLKHKLVREWAIFGVFNIIYFLIGLMVFFLFSIAAIVYTVACIYISKDTHFKKVIRVIPKVWKRLVITFLWNFFIQLVYHVIAAVLLVLSIVLAASSPKLRVLGIALAIILVILYLLGLIYINVIWHLASVVSVLEDSYGWKAMKKGKNLVKGKVILTGGIYVVFQVLLIVVQFLYSSFVANGEPLAVVIRVVIGIVCFVGLLKLVQLGLVVQTIVYFVCKSYHHESIDKSCLDDQLEGYLGNYARLRENGRDVQLEQV